MSIFHALSLSASTVSFSVYRQAKRSNMYCVVLVIPFLMLFSACAPAPGDFEDTADFEMAELDMEDLGMSSDRESQVVHRCPSEQGGAYSVSCDAFGWGPSGLAIAKCMNEINQKLTKDYAKDTCAPCAHGNSCERVLPLWNLSSFDRYPMRGGHGCKLTRVVSAAFGVGYKAQCTRVAQSGKFKCVETDRKSKDEDEYLDDVDEYSPVY